MFRGPYPAAAALAAALSTCHASAADLMITGARVLDPEGVAWLEQRVVMLDGGRIDAIVPADELVLDPELAQLDLGGAYLLPGLIDLHTHLLLRPYDEASWEEQVLKEPLASRTARAVAAARATLEAGFTTVRDLGTEGAGWADVGLRDAIAGGVIAGPTVLAATRAIVATGAYGPSGFDPRWSIPKGAQVADGADGVRRAVREQIAAGADWIKVYADYRRRPGDASTPTLTLAELEAAVDEARAAGLPVAAHAVTDEAIRRAVTAGARTIEHGTGASAETLSLMRKHGVVLCPTLAAGEAIALYRGWSAGDPPPPRVERQMAMFARARESGVTIACGSDAGVFDHGDNVRELELMVAGGLAPADAIRAATVTAAKVLAREDLGRIATRCVADLVAVARDPLADVSALRVPVVVIKNGDVVVDRRAEPADETRDAVLAVCSGFLDAIGDARWDDLLSMCIPGCDVAFDRQPQARQGLMTIEQYVEGARGRPGPWEFREWISGEATVLVDGAVAVVWAPFIVEAGGTRATGIDVFNLLRRDGVWKITAMSFTNRGL